MNMAPVNNAVMQVAMVIFIIVVGLGFFTLLF